MAERMLNGAERLMFLVGAACLADADKSLMKPGDRLNLIHDLRRYIGDEKETDPTLKKGEQDFSLLKPVLDAIHKAVATVADRAVADFPGGKRPAARLDARGEGQPRQYYDHAASLLDTVLPLVFDDLRSWTAVGAGRLRRCADTAGCPTKGGRLFFAGRVDQIFCSRGCAARAGVRAARAKRKKAAKKGAAA